LRTTESELHFSTVQMGTKRQDGSLQRLLIAAYSRLACFTGVYLSTDRCYVAMRDKLADKVHGALCRYG
jgi:hypothetical protein